jgi:predicted nucleic acid-binding protein
MSTLYGGSKRKRPEVMLTDTTFWIDLGEEMSRGERGPARQFLAAHRTFAMEVSIITWGELAAGVNSPGELDQLLRRVKIVHLHLQVAWEAGRIERELAQRGERLGENDNWIAATARAWGLRLVSRDNAFIRVPGLTVVRY